MLSHQTAAQVPPDAQRASADDRVSNPVIGVARTNIS